MKTAYRLTLLLALSLLGACGGGGSSGSSGSTGGSGGSGGASMNYTIGGSVSGLTAGSGAVLLDNGGDALTVPANATSFTFSTSLASGSTYAVTVQTQPSGETCTVGNGSGTATADVTSVSLACTSNFAAGGSNVTAVTVGPGPASSAYQTFNIPLVSVTVCQGSTCGVIQDVLLDSGSEGLRVMASALTAAGVTLTPIGDPNTPGNTIHECAPFVDGYAWGAVDSATVKIGGEATASAIPIQVIDDSSSPNPAVPSSGCINGSDLASVNAFDANGVLGVGVFPQDCGNTCATVASSDVYWTCTSGGSCSATTLETSDQVENPVVAFTTDNNGAIIQLPAIAAAGATTASGYLVFGIGTESDNGLGSAAVLTASDPQGAITTSYDGLMLTNSLIDSGSNALFFPNSSSSPITLCGSSGGAAQFYCPMSNPPSSPLGLSAVMQGQSGTTSNVTFQIVDLSDLSPDNFALPDVGGVATNTSKFSDYFDWGLPFFYGRTVFMGIAGASAGGNSGPFYAY